MRKKAFKKLTSVVLSFVLMAGMVLSVPLANVRADDVPTDLAGHGIPAYQKKDVHASETVQVSSLPVYLNGNSYTGEIVFKVYNTTKQQLQETVTAKNGVLSGFELVKNHNYMIYTDDPSYEVVTSTGGKEYRNLHVWVQGDGTLYNIKSAPFAPYNYETVAKVDIRARVGQQENRVQVSLPTFYGNSDAPVVNANITLIGADGDVVTGTSGEKGKLEVNLKEDVTYIVTGEQTALGYVVVPFPVSVKDKSEYGAGKYSYNHSTCKQVEKITMVKAGEEHSGDSTLKNESGDITVTGMNFGDLMLFSNVSTDSTINVEHEVINLTTVNPHRWEICKLAAGEYTITRKTDKPVEKVYYQKDGTNVDVAFQTTKDGITCKMDTLSMYPVVIEYKTAIDKVSTRVVDINETEATVEVTVKGTSLPSTMFFEVFYKEGENTDVDEPTFDNTVLDIQLANLQGEAIAEETTLYLKHPDSVDKDIKGLKTDANGVLELSAESLKSALEKDVVYTLLPDDSSVYLCDTGLEIMFAYDSASASYYIDKVGDNTYTEELTGSQLKVEKFDNTVLNVHVKDEEGNPVSEEIAFCLMPENASPITGLMTDVSGDLEVSAAALSPSPEAGAEYILLPEDASGYTSDGLAVMFDQSGAILKIGDADYTKNTGAISLVVKIKEVEEPFSNTVLNILVVDQNGDPLPEGVEFYLEYYDSWGDRDKMGDVSNLQTDADGKIIYTIEQLWGNTKDISGSKAGLIDSWGGDYLLKLISDTEYNGEEGLYVSFCEDSDIAPAPDTDWDGFYVEYVGDYEYTEEYVPFVFEVTVTSSASFNLARRTMSLNSPSDNTNLTDETAPEWQSAGNYQAIAETGTGTFNERTFLVKLPLSQFPDAASWKITLAATADGLNPPNPDESDIYGETVLQLTNEKGEAKKQLEQAIKDAETYKAGLKESDYTPESWKTFVDAIKSAKAVAEKDTTALEYNQARFALESAQADLIKVNSSGNDNNQNDDNNQNNNQNGNTGNSSNAGNAGNAGTGTANGQTGGSKTPKTGDAANIYSFAIAMFAAAAMITAMVYKKKEF